MNVNASMEAIRMFKNILFDFDGTLVDTNDLVILALNEAARKFTGSPLSKEKLESVLGYYVEDQMKAISEIHYKEMTAYYNDFYRARQDEMVKEFDGIREMLDALKKKGCRIAIISAKEKEGIEHGIYKFELSEYVDAIVCANDVTNNKPHPEPALKAIAALKADASETLLVGDSPLDIKCGRNAGIKTALVGWTIFPMRMFEDLRPDYIIHDPQELVRMVV
ncbi:hypothetical protein CDQ83_14815 [Clostridium thermosuccinogenes]|nr:hypothetical protein CDQ83_14815 [Pseudoclostridium thermosuccinogenes]